MPIKLDPYDLNPYLWSSYVDSVAESEFVTFYDHCYWHPELFWSVWAGKPSPYARLTH